MTDASTRRGFLKQAIAVPVVAHWQRPSRSEPPLVISERNCLSEESAQGFRSILDRRTSRWSSSAVPKLIVLSAASAVTMDQAVALRKQAQNGAWIIWESSPVYSSNVDFKSQREVLRVSFGIQLSEPTLLTSERLRNSGLYVRYNLPPATILTRTFITIIPVTCQANAVIAHHGNLAVAAKFRIGRGGIVWLGSMLGTHLRAGEREATQIITMIAGATQPNHLTAWCL
jgi:hypothetical protein